MQSSSQMITTNKPRTSRFFTGQMPFLSPNQQCQSTEWKTNLKLYQEIIRIIEITGQSFMMANVIGSHFYHIFKVCGFQYQI